MRFTHNQIAIVSTPLIVMLGLTVIMTKLISEGNKGSMLNNKLKQINDTYIT
jgi:hypothetical protein